MYIQFHQLSAVFVRDRELRSERGVASIVCVSEGVPPFTSLTVYPSGCLFIDTTQPTRPGIYIRYKHPHMSKLPPPSVGGIDIISAPLRSFRLTSGAEREGACKSGCLFLLLLLLLHLLLLLLLLSPSLFPLLLLLLLFSLGKRTNAGQSGQSGC